MKTHTSNTLIDKTRGLRFTESPRWHGRQAVVPDIHDRRIKTADLVASRSTPRARCGSPTPKASSACCACAKAAKSSSGSSWTRGLCGDAGRAGAPHLFICGSDSHDPAQIARTPSAPCGCRGRGAGGGRSLRGEMKLQQVSENCFAVLNEKNLVCDANSGLINLGGGVVVDTQSDLPHGRRMIELFGKVWRAMPKRVVQTPTRTATTSGATSSSRAPRSSRTARSRS